MICSINCDMYKIAVEISAKKDNRTYLCSVHVERHPEGGIVIVATDGHRMIVMYDEHGSLEGAREVNLPQVRKLGKLKPGQQIQFNGENISCGTKEACKLVEGFYPDWREFLFAGEVIHNYPYYFDPGLLAGFDKVCSAYGRGFNTVRLVSTNCGKMQLGYLFFDTLPALGVVMPPSARASWKAAQVEMVPLPLSFKKEVPCKPELACV